MNARAARTAVALQELCRDENQAQSRQMRSVRGQWPVWCALAGQRSVVTTNKPWLVWQLVDSAFPSGGFAHSGGLEAAYQAVLVRSSERLAEFIETQLAAAARG